MLEAAGAIAVGAGPGFAAVFVAAVFAVVGVLHFQQVKIFFPIRAFFLQRDGAITGFDPVRDAVVAEARLFHVVDIFVPGNGAAAEGAVADGGEERFLPAGFHAGFDQITHGKI